MWYFVYLPVKCFLLRFPSFVLCIYAPCKRPRRNQRRTKERPKNSKTQKSTFIKIAISFPSLIPCLILPRDDRENSERTPTQLPTTKKCYFLRLRPNKVVLIPKKVDSHPKKVDSFPRRKDVKSEYISKNVKEMEEVILLHYIIEMLRSSYLSIWERLL